MENYQITNSIITKVVVKRWSDSLGAYEVMHTVDNMMFGTFIDYLDNLSTIAEVHWSVDYLNLGYTRATVYVEF